jgi:hypothetical protein
MSTVTSRSAFAHCQLQSGPCSYQITTKDILSGRPIRQIKHDWIATLIQNHIREEEAQ